MDERPKCETGIIKILENTGSNLFDLGQGDFLQDMSLKARETKAKMNYREFIRIKSFWTAKETSAKLKGNLWNGRKYLLIIYM